jgi:hypothetical protein
MAAQQHWNLRNLYLYLVCLVTLVISIFAAVQFVRSAVELVYPDPGYYGFEPAKDSGMSEEEIARQRQAAEDSQRRNAVLGLVGSGTTLLITGPLYLYHWRRIERELPGATPAAPA